MNVGILIATVLVDLVLGLLGFISMHLRYQIHQRRLKSPPTQWRLFPYDFYRLNSGTRSSDAEKVKTSKVKKLHSELL